MKKIDILAFAAHPDDIELSAAGTILKHIQEGKTVAIVDLTQGELGSRGTIETRYSEAHAAAQILGLSDRVNLKMEDGFFIHSQENLLKIVEQIRYFQPEIVLCNAIEDRHPDHAKGSKLVSDACFLAGLRKIETTYKGEKQVAHRPKMVYHYIQDHYIKPDFVIDVTDFVEQKFASIRAYKTQFFDPNSTEPKTPISGEEFFDFLRGRMAEFGRPIGVKYAEGFTVERILGVESFFDLK
ncbi:MAG: bacillithiol biosynthesis deacetylase BshB1 [Flavobacteriia bacterium]|jgi:bacillithiol biosynthesis deacetylase BshB1